MSTSRIDKATILIEIFPNIGLDGHSEDGNTSGNIGVHERVIGNTNENTFINEQSHRRSSDIKGQSLLFAFEIAPQDFFLGNRKSLEAFLVKPEVHETVYFINKPLDEITEQENSEQDNTKFCVRLRLVPIPETENHKA